MLLQQVLGENKSLARSPVADVYQLIQADLQEAKNLLKENYPSAERARPNKWTATAFAGAGLSL
ncbi:MAG: RagB/SusD family nutrient uptake outer membrane protein [Bacteroidota bacterium]